MSLLEEHCYRWTPEQRSACKGRGFVLDNGYSAPAFDLARTSRPQLALLDAPAPGREAMILSVYRQEIAELLTKAFEPALPNYGSPTRNVVEPCFRNAKRHAVQYKLFPNSVINSSTGL